VVRNDIFPAWSPDGRHIAFYRESEEGNGIYTIPVIGGSETLLYSGDVWSKLSWSPDSKYLAFSATDSSGKYSSIFYLEIETRQKKNLTHAYLQKMDDGNCSISPDGKKLAFVRGATLSSENIYIIPIKGGEAKQITFKNNAIGGIAWTRDGSEIIFSSTAGGMFEYSLWRVPSGGGEAKQVQISGDNLSSPSISQKNQIALEQSVIDLDIYRLKIPNSKNDKTFPTRLIYSTQIEYEARMSPDGKKLTYVSNLTGSQEIYICDIGGKNPNQLTNFKNAGPGSPYWSTDGNTITFDSDHIKGQTDIYIISANGGKPKQITNNAAEDHSPRYSADGQWIYFNSNRSGFWQIWKIPATGGKASQVTHNGGYIAYESNDGEWLYYTKYDTTGIWRMLVHGGKETLILDYLLYSTDWAIVEDGIYFINSTYEDIDTIEYYNVTTQLMSMIYEFKEKYATVSLSISQDKQWFIFTQGEIDVDIVLVENFH
jgi:Tol biopolymer transport system component